VKLFSLCRSASIPAYFENLICLTVPNHREAAQKNGLLDHRLVMSWTLACWNAVPLSIPLLSSQRPFHQRIGKDIVSSPPARDYASAPANRKARTGLTIPSCPTSLPTPYHRLIGSRVQLRGSSPRFLLLAVTIIVITGASCSTAPRVRAARCWNSVNRHVQILNFSRVATGSQFGSFLPHKDNTATACDICADFTSSAVQATGKFFSLRS
jgi:hypothetical protein